MNVMNLADMENAPICPAIKEHGEMVDLLDSGIYYCYDCRTSQWIREGRRLLQRMKESN